MSEVFSTCSEVDFEEGRGWRGNSKMEGVPSTFASICPIVSAICPPDNGHNVRFEDTVSWPPQGKVPSLSSSKPRAAGKSRLKWAVVRVRRAASARGVVVEDRILLLRRERGY